METIHEMQLRDQNIYPDERVLEETLGQSYKIYCELLDLFKENAMEHEWRYYNDGKAWLCKVQKKKKTIVWMSAWKGFFKATLYFPERYLDAIFALDISETMREKIRNAKNSGKSKPCTFEFRHGVALDDFKTIMQFKLTLK